MALPTAGSHIGQYEIVEQVGSGGMATVYKARQSKLDRFVAVKVMHQTFLSDNSFLSRFEREARIVASLDHPNIVPVYDYDDLNGVPYLVMKYVEGRTLKETLSKGALPLDEILRILPAVASALTFAHSRGVLHRDIKPSNILMDDQGTPYLTDFGLARIAQAGESTMSADMMLGTPHYISPEQAQGVADLDARTDVYSLGVVLYELVVGRAPFSGDTPFIIVHKHIYNDPPYPSEVNPEIPTAVSDVIIKALEKQRSDRYNTPNELSEAFRQAVQASGLAHLADDRASISHKAFSQQPSPPPVHKAKNTAKGEGVFVTIPSPVEDRTPPPQLERLLSSEAVQVAADRIRDAIEDIREQVTDGDMFRQVRSGAKDVMVQVQTQIEENGGEFKFEIGSSASRKSRVIQRDWSMDEPSVRRRVRERTDKIRGFVIHFAMYLFIAIGLAGVASPALQLLLTEVFETDPELLPLATINFALLLRVMWGGGLISHALEVFYGTGNRWDARRRAVQKAMARRYGENWIAIATDKEYKKIRRQVERGFKSRLGFFQHFVTAVSVSVAGFVVANPLREMLLLMFADDPETLAFVTNFPAPVVLAAVMAFTVIAHGIVVLFGGMLGAEAEERAIEREIERELSYITPMKAKNDAPQAVRLTGDGELSESFIQEIETPDKQKRR